MQSDRFNAVLRKHLAKYVPLVYAPTPISAPLASFAEQVEGEVERLVLAPLERFLCGGVAQPDAVFAALRRGDAPPALCGKVFRLGEPTYSCKDCGMDHTCVLCVACFEHSAHKLHRYKMRYALCVRSACVYLLAVYSSYCVCVSSCVCLAVSVSNCMCLAVCV